MLRSSYIRNLATCLLGIVFFIDISSDLQAQTNTNPAPSPLSPPALPIVKPPIEYFRELLALPVEERERSIASRGEEQKNILRAKLKEYELKSPEERELRLAVTELRWYLVPLMKTPRAQRYEQLKNVPADKRYLVKDRLQRWDKLSADQQKEFLESEMTINYFLRLQTSTPEQQTNMFQTFSSEHRRRMEQELERWNALPASERNRMSNRFQEFFDLNDSEKQKMLGTLSETERAQMEKTLLTFQKLSGDQRRHCIKSFDKLASMSGSERMQFLQKAEAWEKMSPTDRKSWRELVHQLPRMPPLPPGMKLSPPLPSSMVATNSLR